MGLKEIFSFLKTNYNSREDDVLNDIYLPCLHNSNRYYRGTAYFTASVLSLYRKAVLDFCNRDKMAKISILTSTEVMPKDAENILLGYTLRDLELSLELLLEKRETRDAAKFICTLIASKFLDIHVVKGPLYHDKVGFFKDEDDDVVAFTGSGNETIPGVSKNKNFERYVLSWSERDDYHDYGGIWHQELSDAIDKGVYADAEIYRFDELSDYFMKKHNIPDEIINLGSEFSHEFNYFNYDLLSPNGPQKHQLQAFNGWKNNDQRALFEHATGTYKTATGLMCADYFLGTNDSVVISTPLKMVSENWYNLVKKSFDKNIKVVKCWSDNKNWDEEAIKHILSDEKIIFIFVNNSLWSEKGQELLKIMKGNYLLIADEAHNWEEVTAKRFMKNNLPISRLALTAKLSEPDLENNTVEILNYFSNSRIRYVDSLELRTAIEIGFLRRYEYKLHSTTLDSSYFNLDATNKNVRLIWNEFSNMKRQISPEIAITTLDSKARVLVYTGPKVDHAIETIQSMQAIWNGKNNLPTIFKKVTGKENANQRKNIIRDFTSGLTQSLVAILVLDEGVDLPISDAAIMCRSNASYRQWIQRRGRVLRKKDPKDPSKALIIDFILDLSPFSVELRKKLRKNYDSEVKRMEEFGMSSESTYDTVMESIEESGWK